MKAVAVVLFLLGFSEIVLAQQRDTSVKKKPSVKNDEDHLAPIQKDSVQQVDAIDYLYKIFKIKDAKEKRSDKKIQFSIFPTQSNASNGRTVIASFNAAFLLGDKSNTNVSNVYFIPYISFSNQYGFTVKPNIWLSKNSWNFNGEYFWLSYPQYTWGLGGNSSSDNKTLVDYNYLRVSQNVLKGLPYHFAAGIGYSLDYHYSIYVNENPDSILIPPLTPPGPYESTTSSGATFSFVYDDRKNALNPQTAFYFNSTWRYNTPALGSDSTWNSLFLDARKYFSFSKSRQSVLAFRSYYWTVLSRQPPYLDIPSNGWEPANGIAARGIQQNRYRSNALLYFESEYRFGITRNGLLGGAVFVNVLAPSLYKTQNFIYWRPSAGAGLRLKLNKYSNTNISGDLGFSKGFVGAYLNIGEVF